MPKKAIKPQPLPPDETLYVGIDIGKTDQHIGLCSKTLLAIYKTWQSCPYLKIERSRAGFNQFIAYLQQYAPLERCVVLIENTGHYMAAIEQFLQEKEITSYKHQVKRRPNRLTKTDKRDAQALAATLYNRIENNTQPVENEETFIRIEPASATATLLRGLTQHRYELMQECVRRKNKLTAICDELFPELTEFYKDPNSPSALALRVAFPTPAAVSKASIEELCATRLRTFPGKAQLQKLQKLAAKSIGTKDVNRITGLVAEQRQLARELTLLTSHHDEIERFIERALVGVREAQILLSLPGIGPTHAATILSAIGNIARFKSANALKLYCGWAPQQDQTGSSRDTTTLKKMSNHRLKQAIFLVVCAAVKNNAHWKAYYARLVERKCPYDAKLKKYVHKMPALARVAGEIINMIYYLLRKDYDMLDALVPGAPIPAPVLYDAARHHIITSK